MTQTLDIFQQDDGFYVGRKLKDGKMGKGAYKMTAGDIMTMFTQFFTDYTQETGENRLLMKAADGTYFATVRLKPQEESEKPAVTRKIRKPR